MSEYSKNKTTDTCDDVTGVLCDFTITPVSNSSLPGTLVKSIDQWERVSRVIECYVDQSQLPTIGYLRSFCLCSETSDETEKWDWNVDKSGSIFRN